MQFKKEDLGKRILLELDPEKDDLAKKLGASKVEVSGTPISITNSYVRIYTDPIKLHSSTPGVRDIEVHPSKIKQIRYSSIKHYKFL